MRGRIRTVKPEIFSDEQLWDLAIETGLPWLLQAFEGLWCYADREGRFEWRPRALKTKILPYWDGDFGWLLEVLERGRYIVRYRVGGQEYGYVRGFAKHQRVNAREEPSVLPEPPVNDSCSTNSAPVSEPSPPADDLENPARGEGNGREWELEGNGKGAPRGHAPATPHVPGLIRVLSGGVPRTYQMPSELPPKEYLDEAVMRSVTREQAAATWNHYWTKGLPVDGVEKLFPWLCQQAKDFANRQARASPTVVGADRLSAQAERIEMLRAKEAAAEDAQRKTAP